MAAKKDIKNGSASKTVSEKKKKAATSSKTARREKTEDADTVRYRAIDDPYSLINQILPFVFFVFSVFFFLILIMKLENLFPNLLLSMQRIVRELILVAIQ